MTLSQVHLASHLSKYKSEGIEHISLFGSYSRGENTPESDLDLLVEISKNVPISLFDISRIESEISQILGVHTVQITVKPSRVHTRAARFLSMIQPDIVPIY